MSLNSKYVIYHIRNGIRIGVLLISHVFSSPTIVFGADHLQSSHLQITFFRLHLVALCLISPMIIQWCIASIAFFLAGAEDPSVTMFLADGGRSASAWQDERDFELGG